MKILPRIIMKSEDFKSRKVNSKLQVKIYPGLTWRFWGISIFKFSLIEDED